MRIARLYGWYLPILIGGGATFLFADSATYRGQLFAAISLALFAIGLAISVKQRPCGHGSVSEYRGWYMPLIARVCPRCGTKVW